MYNKTELFFYKNSIIIINNVKIINIYVSPTNMQ